MVAHGDLRGDVDECVRVPAGWLDAELRQRQKVNGDSGQRIWGEDDAVIAGVGAAPWSFIEKGDGIIHFYKFFTQKKFHMISKKINFIPNS